MDCLSHRSRIYKREFWSTQTSHIEGFPSLMCSTSESQLLWELWSLTLKWTPFKLWMWVDMTVGPMVIPQAALLRLASLYYFPTFCTQYASNALNLWSAHTASKPLLPSRVPQSQTPAWDNHMTGHNHWQSVLEAPSTWTAWKQPFCTQESPQNTSTFCMRVWTIPRQ